MGTGPFGLSRPSGDGFGRVLSWADGSNDVWNGWVHLSAGLTPTFAAEMDPTENIKWNREQVMPEEGLRVTGSLEFRLMFRVMVRVRGSGLLVIVRFRWVFIPITSLTKTDISSVCVLFYSPSNDCRGGCLEIYFMNKMKMPWMKISLHVFTCSATIMNI